MFTGLIRFCVTFNGGTHRESTNPPPHGHQWCVDTCDVRPFVQPDLDDLKFQHAVTPLLLSASYPILIFCFRDILAW